ncbi:hypothetical protein HID58_024634 [Brassica napus]|uniref:Uncharacterized protein n=1 Tax=Brassica napus TaxID=3708 RepID=A0ABQ8CIQ2_BRANA|nr:hypothetical protein HID58_024634 [Brassica napus]
MNLLLNDIRISVSSHTKQHSYSCVWVLREDIKKARLVANPGCYRLRFIFLFINQL